MDKENIWSQAFRYATPILLTIIGFYYITNDQRLQDTLKDLDLSVTQLNSSLHILDTQQAVNVHTIGILLENFTNLEVRVRTIEIDHDAFRNP